MSELGRKHVRALYMRDIEQPSDYGAVLYIELDPNGAWKAKLARECARSVFRWT